MFSSKNFQRRVSITHNQHGVLAVRISRNNNWSTYVLMLIFCTAIFVWFASMVVSGLVRRPSSSDVFYVLLPSAFIVLWYLLALRVSLWRSFGIEEVVIEGGRLHWTRRALVWVRRLEISTRNITDVKAVTPWHGLSNHVDVFALGKRRKIGDMLLHDEAIELAQQLGGAVGLGQ